MFSYEMSYQGLSQRKQMKVAFGLSTLCATLYALYYSLGQPPLPSPVVLHLPIALSGANSR